MDQTKGKPIEGQLDNNFRKKSPEPRAYITSYADQKLSSSTNFLTSLERRRLYDIFRLFGTSDHIMNNFFLAHF